MSQRAVAGAALVWTAGLIFAHAAAPMSWQWGVAAGFSVTMNLVYPWRAIRTGSSTHVELSVAGLLIAMSIAGAILSPWWLVAAVAGHGLWDLAKHFGAGVKFFSWYTWSCAAVDGLWASFLAFIILQVV